MVQKLTTESGRVYHVDLEDGFWSRSPQHYTHRIWDLQAGTEKAWPWDSDTWEARMPQIGEHLYISSRDEWYVSNKIVSIEEV